MVLLQVGVCICLVLVVVLGLLYTQFHTVLHSADNTSPTAHPGGKGGHTTKVLS